MTDTPRTIIELNDAFRASFFDATVAAVKGQGGFRRKLFDLKSALVIQGNEELNGNQHAVLVDYRDFATLAAMSAFVSKAAKPTLADIATAKSILALKGYSSQAKEGDGRRTHAQQQVLTNIAQQWSTACKKLDIPAIDARGKARGVKEAQGADADTNEGATPKIASFGFERDTSPAVFAEGMAQLAARYIAEQGKGLTGEYASVITNFVADVSALRAKG
jgi:hypothetical protein